MAHVQPPPYITPVFNPLDWITDPAGTALSGYAKLNATNNFTALNYFNNGIDVTGGSATFGSVPTTAGTVDGGGSGQQLITLDFANSTYTGGTSIINSVANYYDASNFTGATKQFTIFSEAAAWDIEDFFTISYDIFVQYNYYPGNNPPYGSPGYEPPGWRSFMSIVGTMNIYPNRAIAKWGITGGVPTMANINNDILGNYNFWYADQGTTNAGFPTIPYGRPFFSNDLVLAGNNNTVFMSGVNVNLSDGTVAFNINNPSGYSSGLPFDTKITVQLRNVGPHPAVIQTANFTNNFTF